VLADYGVVALPCRVGDPDHKGKVEAVIRDVSTDHIRRVDLPNRILNGEQVEGGAE
jgi:transposase